MDQLAGPTGDPGGDAEQSAHSPGSAGGAPAPGQAPHEVPARRHGVRPHGPSAAPEAARRAYRIDEGRWLGGVCAGLSQHLGWPVMLLRLAFVGLTMTQFVGAVVYAVLWVALPPEPPRLAAPGLESAARTGARTVPTRLKRRIDMGSALAMALFGGGVLWLVQMTRFGMPWRVFWPVMLASAGVAVIWREADSMGTWRGNRGAAGVDRSRVDRLGSLLGALTGLLLLATAFVLVIPDQARRGGTSELMMVLILSLGGVAVVGAPWFFRTRAELDRIREEKIRADARADMAAHLHDSVLQTLALIQRQASDPRAVARLARRQERELREWLYGRPPDDTTLGAAVRRAALEVEEEHDIDIELVTVGDTTMTPDLDSLVKAAREAMVNAAKHAGVDRVDVYAEVLEDTVEVFVRDRGQGFDLAAIDDDRQGVRRSIMERMERHGGRATIRSAPGQGTDVRLEMTR
ncbi:ATP-binding protein [Raineyella fluvialis]|uniref:PspC domain-containing protein n=1 Tax=Raineyella fluvialis TaxID=2662261 RepID=A0A5Q2F7A8_9ACTN|nr:ATP-binding protein [Raineyella fluvialis]QGF22538.1 PspC domain-containing protein [Raineyella fluvialis]